MAFGLPGDGINGIMEALRKRSENIRSSKCGTKNRRRSWPAPMRSSREAWLLPRTSSPGGIHLLNGLYDAKLDGAPVLAADVANLAKPLMRGTSARDKIVKTILRDTARELI